MRTLDLNLTLLDDLVLSERPATEGGHESLDYIPGAALLGAASARLYADLDRADAYRVFHSGAVRFGDALPTLEGLPAWPMPLCWHHAKGQTATDGAGRLLAEQVRNLQHGDLPSCQPKQLRDGYIRADGLLLKPAKTLRMKTAIDPASGRVAESQLFGYEAVRAGQSYAARIESDEAVPDALWQKLIGLFDKPTEILLGRSRSAEYGRVRAEPATRPLEWPATVPNGPGGTLILWCLSDLALVDAWGQPTLDPSPMHLGLSRGRLDPDRTFLRLRRYAPWNGHRRAPDLQRQVIRRGSVIALTDLEPPLTRAEQALLTAGVGLYREQGLGRLCLNPALLADATPGFGKPIQTGTAESPPARPNHPLVDWLARQAGAGKTRSDAEAGAKALARELHLRYALARAYAGIPDGLPIGPSPAQWGSVYEAARLARDIAALRRTLFDGDGAICKPKGENWQDQFRDDQGVRSFRDWFKDVAQAADLTVETLRRFAREAQRIAQCEHGRGERQGRTA